MKKLPQEQVIYPVNSFIHVAAIHEVVIQLDELFQKPMPCLQVL